MNTRRGTTPAHEPAIAIGSVSAVIPAPSTPTQVAHPWKAVLRTFVAAGVGVAVAWLVRYLGVDLTMLSQPIIDSLTAGAWAVATGFAQWLLTLPGLQPALRVIGLGTGVEREPTHRA